ncbi:MAG: metallophosphoesterase [Candidatus Odinarchaeota archaeon]
MGTWFTSDWHLSHKNIMKYSKRPYKTVEEMDKTIMENFNNLVKENDEVYYLGDFCFKKDRTEEYLNEMKGKLYFVMGNHDRHIKHVLKKYCEAVWDLKEIKVNMQSITLSHYPMYTHNKSHYNAWNLYGHHHRETGHLFQGKKMNVSVDVTRFKPVPFEEVSEYMASREDNWDLIKRER